MVAGCPDGSDGRKLTERPADARHGLAARTPNGHVAALAVRAALQGSEGFRDRTKPGPHAGRSTPVIHRNYFCIKGSSPSKGHVWIKEAMQIAKHRKNWMPRYTEFSTLNDISDQLEVEWVRSAFANLMVSERDFGDARLMIAIDPAEVPPGYQIAVVMDLETGEGMVVDAFSPKTHRSLAAKVRGNIRYSSAEMTKADFQELLRRMLGYQKPNKA